MQPIFGPTVKAGRCHKLDTWLQGKKVLVGVTGICPKRSPCFLGSVPYNRMGIRPEERCGYGQHYIMLGFSGDVCRFTPWNATVTWHLLEKCLVSILRSLIPKLHNCNVPMQECYQYLKSWCWFSEYEPAVRLLWMYVLESFSDRYQFSRTLWCLVTQSIYEYIWAVWNNHSTSELFAHVEPSVHTCLVCP